MAPQEVHRYGDTRGDTVIIKFDPDLIPSSALATVAQPLTTNTSRRPTPLSQAVNATTTSSSKNEGAAAALSSRAMVVPTSTEIPGPISIFHEWRQDLSYKTNWSSLLLDKESAIERFAKDKKPAPGFLLWEGTVIIDGIERWVRARWMGFEKNELGCVIERAGK
ncbi:hypothetical protein P280DRAFT_466506 [Massarina eburnea CBS 473.64]|uniref:Uncharacterized protein n=1 Tax=Massarina eburnea CBS 473.64 TaxID=1395130 RepID=A0A6A6SC86_9PLEO|nr:hypothetical protein P280DRAFT_466506 [Massarina eburnea CBS 473.64]